MTRLILPTEHDRVVTRMIQNIEFLRAAQKAVPASMQVFELPPHIADKPLPTRPTTIVEDPTQSPNYAVSEDQRADDARSAHSIDWWAEVRSLIDESDEEAFKRWLLEQGHTSYVSIMQGPLPITNSVRGTLPSTQEDATGYMNSYGDMEYKISENCVATTQVAARLDQSDLARALPMRITCKAPAKQTFTFDRYDRE